MISVGGKQLHFELLVSLDLAISFFHSCQAASTSTRYRNFSHCRHLKHHSQYYHFYCLHCCHNHRNRNETYLSTTVIITVSIFIIAPSTSNMELYILKYPHYKQKRDLTIHNTTTVTITIDIIAQPNLHRMAHFKNKPCHPSTSV